MSRSPCVCTWVVIYGFILAPRHVCFWSSDLLFLVKQKEAIRSILNVLNYCRIVQLIVLSMHLVHLAQGAPFAIGSWHHHAAPELDLGRSFAGSGSGRVSRALGLAALD